MLISLQPRNAILLDANIEGYCRAREHDWGGTWVIRMYAKKDIPLTT